MSTKPSRADGYPPEAVRYATSTLLYIATKLGDLQDDMVVVGGLVPSLIIRPDELPAGRSHHIGTMDVDLALAVAVLDEKKYHEICERLRSAGFEPDVNDAGNPANQRWRIEVDGRRILVDFLIPPTLPKDKGGRLRNLEPDFAAIITPGLELAFADKQRVRVAAKTIRGEEAIREVNVCDAGAFVVLKALAFAGRGENKDAYDLYYVLQNYGGGIEDVVKHLQPHLDNHHVQTALQILQRDFTTVDSVGAKRVAEFLGSPQDEDIRADASAAVRSLLRLCGKVV